MIASGNHFLENARTSEAVLGPRIYEGAGRAKRGLGEYEPLRLTDKEVKHNGTALQNIVLCHFDCFRKQCVQLPCLHISKDKLDFTSHPICHRRKSQAIHCLLFVCIKKS